MHPHTKRKIQFALLVAAGLYTVVLLSATHATKLPTGPNVSDKIVHFAAYTPLACILVIVLRLRGARRFAIAATVASLIVLGALDEITQGFVPGRTPDVQDWLADTIGILLGTSVALLLTSWLPNSGTPKKTN
jgi:VanZ family protein